MGRALVLDANSLVSAALKPERNVGRVEEELLRQALLQVAFHETEPSW
jgi:hypothetical protein